MGRPQPRASATPFGTPTLALKLLALARYATGSRLVNNPGSILFGPELALATRLRAPRQIFAPDFICASRSALSTPLVLSSRCLDYTDPAWYAWSLDYTHCSKPLWRISGYPGAPLAVQALHGDAGPLPG